MSGSASVLAVSAPLRRSPNLGFSDVIDSLKERV